MSEIKKDLIRLKKGELYSANGDNVVITESHTFSDIIRFLLSEGCDRDEIESILNKILE